MGKSKFNLSDDWKDPETQKYGGSESYVTRLAYKGQNDLYVYVREFTSKEEFDSSYGAYTRNVAKKTINISGISVKFIKNDFTFTQNPRIVLSYYFTKNGMYYDISFEDYRTNMEDQLMIDEAVNSIISTLN